MVAGEAALVAFGCRASRSEPLPAAFEAETPGFAGMISLLRIRRPGLGPLRWLRKPDCLLHLLSDESEAPVHK